MSKIICDICGTSYPDTAECCPICGCSKDSAMEFLGETIQAEEPAEETGTKKGRYAGKKRREIFDYDEVNHPPKESNVQAEETTDDDDDDEEFDRPRSNTFVVICLTILIVVLLLATAFLGFRYILPNMGEDKPAPVPETFYADPEEDMTEYEIPCQNLGLISGAEAVLNEEGAYFLIHVNPMPEDTTDKVYYASADESIATVDEDGRITAVSEGETVIYIACGNIQQTCRVICDFTPETIPTTEAETTPVEETEAPTEGAEEEATEAPTEAPTEAHVRPDVTLKLKKTDVTLGVPYSFRLELDCDLKPEDVEWSVEHPHIASVDETGWVTAKKTGTTAVIVKYGDQEVQCIVRCG